MATTPNTTKYSYSPIFNWTHDQSKAPEIIGWTVRGNIQGWLPHNKPPRVIDHSMLQYYDVTITPYEMTIHWEDHSEKEVVRRWGRNIGVSVVL